MARSRNLKPGFFSNDGMAENDPLGRLLFLGLTTLADHKGDIEWRPKRIKVQVLPYDDCDIQKLAINLDKSGFVRFYSVGDSIYLNIVNFEKHQNPHKNEIAKGSEIPAYSGNARQAVDLSTLTINRDKNGLNPDDSDSDPADSFNLIPDSLNPNKTIVPSDAGDGSREEDGSAGYPDNFESLWKSFPSDLGSKGSKKRAFDEFKKLNPPDALINRMLFAVTDQIENKRAIKEAGEFSENFPHVERWIKNRRWEDELQDCPKKPAGFIDRATDKKWAQGFVEKHSDKSWREGLYGGDGL